MYLQLCVHVYQPLQLNCNLPPVSVTGKSLVPLSPSWNNFPRQKSNSDQLTWTSISCFPTDCGILICDSHRDQCWVRALLKKSTGLSEELQSDVKFMLHQITCSRYVALTLSGSGMGCLNQQCAQNIRETVEIYHYYLTMCTWISPN